MPVPIIKYSDYIYPGETLMVVRDSVKRTMPSKPEKEKSTQPLGYMINGIFSSACNSILNLALWLKRCLQEDLFGESIPFEHQRRFVVLHKGRLTRKVLKQPITSNTVVIAISAKEFEECNYFEARSVRLKHHQKG